MNADLLDRLLGTCMLQMEERAPAAPDGGAFVRGCFSHLLENLQEAMEREISVRDAAEIAGLSRSQVRRMIRQGKLSRRGGDGERLRVVAAELPIKKEHRIKTLSVIRRYARMLREVD